TAHSSIDGKASHVSAAGVRLLSSKGNAPLERSDWGVRSSSRAESDHSGASVVDDDANTFWLSEEGDSPHHLIFDFSKPFTIAALRYLPRQDGETASSISGFSLHISEDGEAWSDAILRGVFVAESGLENAASTDE